jgi:hypothetical protein
VLLFRLVAAGVPPGAGALAEVRQGLYEALVRVLVFEPDLLVRARWVFRCVVLSCALAERGTSDER